MKKKIFSNFMFIALVFAMPFAFMGCNNSETDDLNKQIQELQQEKIDYLEQQIDELQKENSALEDQNAALEDQKDELEDQNAALEEEMEALEQIIDETTAFYQLEQDEDIVEIQVKNGTTFVCSNISNMSILYLDSTTDCNIDIDRWSSDYFGDYEVVSVDESSNTNYTTPGSGFYKFVVSMEEGTSATLTLTLTQTARA